MRSLQKLSAHYRPRPAALSTDQPPPMPRMTRPLPPHSGHSLPSASLPLPEQPSQMSSAAPGVPGLASSPGFSSGSVFTLFSVVSWLNLHRMSGAPPRVAPQRYVTAHPSPSEIFGHPANTLHRLEAYCVHGPAPHSMYLIPVFTRRNCNDRTSSEWTGRPDAWPA